MAQLLHFHSSLDLLLHFRSSIDLRFKTVKIRLILRNKWFTVGSISATIRTTSAILACLTSQNFNRISIGVCLIVLLKIKIVQSIWVNLSNLVISFVESVDFNFSYGKVPSAAQSNDTRNINSKSGGCWNPSEIRMCVEKAWIVGIESVLSVTSLK